MTDPPRLTPQRLMEIRADVASFDVTNDGAKQLLAEIDALRQERETWQTLTKTLDANEIEQFIALRETVRTLEQEQEALRSAVRATCEAHNIALEREDQAKAELSSLRQAHARLQEEHKASENDVFWACAQRDKAEARWQALNIEQMRGNLHATFNGGYHEDVQRSAFHHGMDTVCNVLESFLKGESSNGILPLALDPSRPTPGTRVE